MSFIARNHPQQVSVNGALDEVDDRGTTAWVPGGTPERRW